MISSAVVDGIDRLGRLGGHSVAPGVQWWVGGVHVAAPRISEATAATADRPAAVANTTVSPSWNGAEIRCGKNARPVRAWTARRRQVVQRVMLAEQVLDRVDPEQRAEHRGDRRQSGELRGNRVRDARVQQPGLQCRRQAGGEPGDHQREEHADRDRGAGVLEGRAHPGCDAAFGRGHAAHDRGRVGRGEHPGGDADQRQQQREHGVREVHRQQHQADEAGAGQRRAGGGQRRGSRICRTGCRRSARRSGSRRSAAACRSPPTAASR